MVGYSGREKAKERLFEAAVCIDDTQHRIIVRRQNFDGDVLVYDTQIMTLAPLVELLRDEVVYITCSPQQPYNQCREDACYKASILY